MRSCLPSIMEKLATTEQEIQGLPGELESVVARLDAARLGRLDVRLGEDFERLLDMLFEPQRSRVSMFPYVCVPSSPLLKEVTAEDLVRWREAHKAEVWVRIGKGGVSLMACSGAAGENKAIELETIDGVLRQGHLVLRWEHYLRLLIEIRRLARAGEGRSVASGAGNVVVGILVGKADPGRKAGITSSSP